jgi:4-amino-4-deoxy-L-arabinose transferase-like glycosyltransferase
MVEREWREASDMRPSVAGLGVVLAVAAILRFWALGSGIPFAVAAGEPELMARVVRMMQTGDFNPHFFDQPALYAYVQLAVACLRFVFGASAGSWGALGQVTADDFYLWGRFVTAVLGTATVYLVYLIGMRWGARHALLAAGLMAVIPNHVRESHYVLTNVPMAFFTTLSFLLTLRALEKQTLGAFGWAGATAGLAAATKYPGGLILVAPLLAAYLISNPSRPRRSFVLSALGAAVGSFLIAAPCTLFDLPHFLDGLAHVAGTAQGSHAGGEPGWVTYANALRGGLWWPGIALLLWGTGQAVVRATGGPGKARFALLVAFPGLYVAVAATRAGVEARSLMPVFPMASLLIAIAIVSGVSVLRRFSIPRAARTALIVAFTVVAILPPAIAAIVFDRSAGRVSTYALAYSWISQHVPAGSNVVVEAGDFRLPAARYHVVTVGRLIDVDYETYLARRVDYLVAFPDAYGNAPGAAHRHPTDDVAYQSLLARTTLVQAIDPSRTNPGPQIRILKCVSSVTPVTDSKAVEKVNRPGR